MGFRSVRFYNYRNLRDSEIVIDAPEVFLIGENGQGKTNFVESLYLVSFGSSFRTSKGSNPRVDLLASSKSKTTP